MSPRLAWTLKLAGGLLLLVILALLFPPLAELVETAGRELRYLWWLVLLVLVAVWLIWGLGRKRK